MLRNTLLFSLILCIQWHLAAQDSLKCQDIIYLEGGSVFRGTMTQYDPAGMLSIVTWNGINMQVPSNTVKRIVQECQQPRSVRGERQYRFKETGWYHNSRAAMLFGDVENGYSLQHSSGYKVNRFLSFGAGIGLENYAPGTDPVIAPLFIEIRGYLTKQKITPFYAIGFGQAYIAKQQQSYTWWGGENNIQNWRGGKLFQGQVGYRIGNNFMTFIGIRLQHLELDWDNSVWSGGYGTDKHLKKRIEFGVGLLL